MIGSHQAGHAGQHRSQQRKQMVLPHVPGQVPGRRRGQHQQRIDDQQAHPGHGQGDHHGDGDGEHRLLPEHPDAPAVGQGGVDGGEHEGIVNKEISEEVI